MTDLFGFVYKYDLVSGTRENKLLATKVTAYPNPTPEQLNIGFELEQSATVALNIYDLNGRLVKGFAEGNMAAGPQSLVWDARSAMPGTYFYHLLVDGRVMAGIIGVAR